MRHRVFPFCYSTSYASSPVAPWLDEFSTWHTVTGYSRAALRSHMCVVRRVFEAHSVVAITTHFSDADLKHLFATRVRRAQFAAARYAFTRFLRDRDAGNSCA